MFEELKGDPRRKGVLVRDVDLFATGTCPVYCEYDEIGSGTMVTNR